ncbi:MAG: hypothetical protein WC936_06185 [Candidatus Nanoarchaeia archaeon]|jgi:hypothetical protein
MKPVQNDAPESANIISIETLKRANAPATPVTSIAADIFNGLESISKNPVIAPLFTAGANALQAYAMQIVEKAKNKPQNTSENDGKVLFE